MADDQRTGPDGAGPWLGGRSRWTDLGGPVHYLDFGGPADGPVIVCVHGLGGSAVNWSAIAPLLTGCCRLLAPDARISLGLTYSCPKTAIAPDGPARPLCGRPARRFVLEAIMGAGQTPAGSGQRIGLVLGAGGVLGAAWMTGALPAVQERLPCALSDVDVIVGTSAGSVVAAALRCRSSIEEMIAYQRGQATGVLRSAGVPAALEGGRLPPRPQLRVGSPPLMLASLLRPHRVHPSVGASAWLLRGRGQHAGLRAMVHALHHHSHSRAAPHGSPPPWVDRPTWIVAVDYDSGQRVVFGRDGAPPASLPDAVVASCSIPGWYEPAVINGRRYIDGGVRSPTSLGLIALAGVDEVYVLAPMASVEAGRTRKPHERLERRLRWLITHALLREAHGLRSRGIKVTVVTPGAVDLAVMGVNLMDPRRREAVLETSLRTSAAALARAEADQSRVA